MVVKTLLSNDEFNYILSNYDIGEFLGFKPFKLGAVQTNLMLKTTKGNFAFKLYENRPKEYVLFEIELLQYLVKHTYPCPKPINNIQGEFLGIYNNKPFVLFNYFEGKHSKNINNYKQVVHSIGKLHNITIGYKPKFYYSRDTYDQKSCWKNALFNSNKII